MRRWSVLALLAPVVLGAAYLVVQRTGFHEVIPGEMYRSAQPSGAALRRFVRDRGIRSVINLRLPGPDDEWYEEELEAAKDLGVKHHTIGMFASTPRVDQVIELHDLIGRVERPFLVHCRAGIERTGLASVLALLIEGRRSLDEIARQAGWRFGAFGEDNPGRAFLAQYRTWLDENGMAHSAGVLERWLRTDYTDPTGNIHFLVHPIGGKNWYKPFGGFDEGEKFTLKRSEHAELALDGWAFDSRRGSVLAGVDVFLDGQPMAEVAYGIPSPWLLDDFGRAEILRSGWAARHPMERLSDGCHTLSFRFERLDGSAWRSPPAGRICVR